MSKVVWRVKKPDSKLCEKIDRMRAASGHEKSELNSIYQEVDFS